MYSIIVATYNRIDEIQELIKSIDELDYQEKFELVIVDDGSTDDTKKYVTELNKSYQIQYLYQQNKGPGAARNYGMTEAKGDYFIFVDSDCILPSHWLSEIDTQVKEHKYDAFGGPDTFHPSFSPLLKAIDYSMTSFLGTGGTRGSKKSVTRFYPRSFNMGISKEIFSEIGGMNDLRHGQDMDFSMRIYRAGYKVGLIENAFVYHKRRTSLKKFFKQIFNWGVARINLGRKYPEMLKPIHLAPAVIVALFFIVLILSPFSSICRKLLKSSLFIGSGIGLFASIQSFKKYKNIKVSLLSIVTLFLQIFAYGLGAISGIIQHIHKGKAEGIKKNYYK